MKLLLEHTLIDEIANVLDEAIRPHVAFSDSYEQMKSDAFQRTVQKAVAARDMVERLKHLPACNCEHK